MDIAADEDNVYFADWSGGRILRGGRDGRVTPLAGGQTFAFRSPIVVDATHVYWVAEAGMMQSAILRVAKSGTAPPEVVLADQPAIAGLAGDAESLYFTCCFGGKVGRLEKHDGRVRDVATGLRGPVGIAMDKTNVYWASKDDGLVSTLPKTASGHDAPIVVARGLVNPYAVAVDATHVFWSTAQKAAGTIACAPRDGSGPVETLATGQDNPTSIALSATHVYWSTMTTLCRCEKPRAGAGAGAGARTDAGGRTDGGRTGALPEVLASGPAGPRSLPQLSAFAPKGLVVVADRAVYCVNIAGRGSLFHAAV